MITPSEDARVLARLAETDPATWTRDELARVRSELPHLLIDVNLLDLYVELLKSKFTHPALAAFEPLLGAYVVETPGNSPLSFEEIDEILQGGPDLFQQLDPY